MMNLIEHELKERKKYSTTENGAIGYKSTESALVDLNFKVSSLRSASKEEIIELFDKAFHENKFYAMKWLFFARDVRGGLGERRLFRICYERLVDLDVDLFYMNLNIISEYGRWDDLIHLIGISDVTDARIINIINVQLMKDLNNLKENKPISLLGKWLPSENASSKNTKKLARKIIKLMNTSPRKYRLMLSELRSYLDVVEIKMCDNNWGAIDYNKVPSLANLKYKSAFIRHDEDRRRGYLNSLRKGESKMNMSVATPVDIVTRYMSIDWGVTVNEYDDTLELAWEYLADVDVENTLVVADGSGSMLCRVGNSKRTTALDVANALAIYTSEHNTGVYKNKYITFSNTPQFVDLSEKKTLKGKLETALDHDEISNTNIEAVFYLILDVAVKNNISPDEMVNNILIISDMEFDMAQRGWSNRNVLTKTLFDNIKEEYENEGYKLPKLVFWNVNSRTGTIPLIENELGVALVSGFSQNVLKMVMSSNYNPYDVLVEMITNERYDKVKV